MERLAKDCSGCRGPKKGDHHSHKDHNDHKHRPRGRTLEPRGDCDPIDTVRVGFFDARQPFADLFGEETAGFDVSLAWYIFHDLLGYNVEFYQVPTAAVGLRELTCGYVDVVASSSVNVDALTEDIPRTDLTNFLVTDNGPQLNLAVIYNSELLSGVTCGPDTLVQIWNAFAGNGVDPVVPADLQSFRIGTNAGDTVQSNALFAALQAAFPNTTTEFNETVGLEGFFNTWTVATQNFTCEQFASRLQNNVGGPQFVALLPGPRGDAVQMNAIFNLIPADQRVPLGPLDLCEDVAVDQGGARGWSIRSCKLMLEAQRALDAAIGHGVYPSLIRQVQEFPGFDQECVIVGIGETFLIVPPTNNFSIRVGAVSAGCLECLCKKKNLREPGCPCAPPLIRRFPVAGAITVPTYGDCENAIFTPFH